MFFDTSKLCYKLLNKYIVGKHTFQPLRNASSSHQFNYIIDKWKGVHINCEECKDITLKTFEDSLKESLLKWKDNGFKAVWVKVPIRLSAHIPVLAKQGFVFHHADKRYSMLYLWLLEDEASRIPLYASHQVGVAGCCIDEKSGKVLLVKEKGRYSKFWKFPGGLSNLSEDIGDTAVREVKEETGIDSEFKSIIAMRQHHDFPAAFGKSDFYIVTRLKPLSFDISACNIEVEDCCWMGLNKLQNTSEITPITNRMTKLVMYGMKWGFEKIDFSPEQFKSVYKGQTYWLFHSKCDD